MSGSRVTTTKFRTLLVDDDAELVKGLKNQLAGVQEIVGRHRIVPDLETLIVRVEKLGDGTFGFARSTLDDIVAISHRKFDYVIVDYAYASKDMQAYQWNEDGKSPSKKPSNRHLLTVVDLRDAVVEHVAGRSRRDRNAVEKFFKQAVRVQLRSFQHDRPDDKLGSYADREKATKGVFVGAVALDALDGFALIYGSNPTLRDQFYHEAQGGRLLYRNVATQITIGMYRSAMIAKLVETASRVPVARIAWVTGTAATLIGVIGALIQLVSAPLVAAIVAKDWVAFTALSLFTLIGLGAYAFIIAWIVRWVVNRSVLGEEVP